MAKCGCCCLVATSWIAVLSADLSLTPGKIVGLLLLGWRGLGLSLNWFLRRESFLEVIWLPPDSYRIRSREK